MPFGKTTIKLERGFFGGGDPERPVHVKLNRGKPTHLDYGNLTKSSRYEEASKYFPFPLSFVLARRIASGLGDGDLFDGRDVDMRSFRIDTTKMQLLPILLT